jgi:hypothetical protein
MRNVKRILTSLFLVALLSSVSILAQDLVPDDLEFRRQAVRRMIFDRSQDIPLPPVGLEVLARLQSMMWPLTASMDRLNFPGMQGSNWTYGAMYLYYAFPVSGD